MTRTNNTIHIGDGLTEDIAQIRNELNTQRECIANIKNNMSYLQSIWDSPAQKKFSQRFEADSRSMLEFCDLMTQYLNQIENLANNYTNANVALRNSIAQAQM